MTDRDDRGSRGDHRGISAGLSWMLGEPRQAFFPAARLEFSANREAVIEGCKGILEYSDTVVRLSVDRMVVRLRGRDLELKSMSSSTVAVRGIIASVDFTL